ncbi:MAG: CoA transferase [Actinomycetota bacterium]
MDAAQAHRFVEEFDRAVTAPPFRGGGRAEVRFTGSEGALPSVFAVTEFAAASVACAGRATARLRSILGGSAAAVEVDARLASWWYVSSLRPDGWERGDLWDAIAGIYPTADGWIRLHTNAPHHREAAVAALGCADERSAVAGAVATWRADELEAAIVAAGGCAAVLRSGAAWAEHPQGRAVAVEPLVDHLDGTPGPAVDPISRADRTGPSGEGRGATPERPLTGVRVLDLTRVLAGPVATRHLAGLGADVLRIDPPWWDEPGVASEVTLGKRCVRLDLRSADGIDRLRRLLAGADVLVHGYRSDALDRLGLGLDARSAIAPGLVDIALDAYGWTGPWATRRGFDSLVQLSSGIANAPVEQGLTDEPTPLPAQALDHATGYLMAAAALEGWCDRIEHGRGSVARLSLARTARSLADGPRSDLDDSLAPPTDADHDPVAEPTSWGPGHRLLPPVRVGDTALRWDRPATALGSEGGEPSWLPRR